MRVKLKRERRGELFTLYAVVEFTVEQRRRMLEYGLFEWKLGGYPITDFELGKTIEFPNAPAMLDAEEQLRADWYSLWRHLDNPELFSAKETVITYERPKPPAPPPVPVPAGPKKEHVEYEEYRDDYNNARKTIILLICVLGLVAAHSVLMAFTLEKHLHFDPTWPF